MSPHTPPGETRERIYRFVRDRLRDGLPPTVREVQAAFGFRAVQTAREHLERLVTEGRLIKRGGIARGYALPSVSPAAVLEGEGVYPGKPPTMIPLLGRVHAGGLHEAIEHLEGYVPVESRNPESLFGLRVHGESMIGAGILPGDIVIVTSQPRARSGEVVVALVEDEATVKTLRHRRGGVELHPANPDFDIIRPDPRTFTILGKVIEVRRNL
jgi:repressor LexA